MIKLLLVDDEARIRQGWRMRLALESDMMIVGEAADEETAMALAIQTQPDIVLMDIKLAANTNGLAVTRRLTATVPVCKVIIVTLYNTPAHRKQAKIAGAVAFVPKQESPEILIKTIQTIAQASTPGL